MNYVIYTTEGFTQTPTGDAIENCQILAFETAENEAEVKEIFFSKHPSLFNLGFTKEQIVVRQII